MSSFIIQDYLQDDRTRLSRQDKAMALYIRNLKKTADCIDGVERRYMGCYG